MYRWIFDFGVNIAQHLCFSREPNNKNRCSFVRYKKLLLIYVIYYFVLSKNKGAALH